MNLSDSMSRSQLTLSRATFHQVKHVHELNIHPYPFSIRSRESLTRVHEQKITRQTKEQRLQGSPVQYWISDQELLLRIAVFHARIKFPSLPQTDGLTQGALNTSLLYFILFIHMITRKPLKVYYRLSEDAFPFSCCQVMVVTRKKKRRLL